jgi:hypothetical protein
VTASTCPTTPGAGVQINREKIVKVLEQGGHTGLARRAAAELPARFDPHEHADLLREFGLEPQRLVPEGEATSHTTAPPASD